MNKRDMRIEIEELKDRNRNLSETLDIREERIVALTPKPPKPKPKTWAVAQSNGSTLSVVADYHDRYGEDVYFFRDGEVIAEFREYASILLQEQRTEETNHAEA